VKVFDKQLLLDPKDKSAILKEIQILRLMNHPNVLTIIECFESD
jgi:calcium/calmodulin-dependent protein kinase I